MSDGDQPVDTAAAEAYEEYLVPQICGTTDMKSAARIINACWTRSRARCFIIVAGKSTTVHRSPKS